MILTLLVNETFNSLLQIRGSIPLLWSQKPTLKYNPSVVIRENNEGPFKLHMDSLIKKYKNVLCVNLIDNKGSQKKLADTYASLVENFKSNAVRYVFFDFHHECRKDYANVDKLVKECSKSLDSFGYFSCNLSKKEILSLQSGAIRTNCMDNLDRTNVVQSVFAKTYVNDIFKTLGLVSKDSNFDADAVFSKLYKNLWADHADGISTMYSGTGALKNDFTRTGKRTYLGLLSDGSNSLIRYYLNNFTDGKRQDSMNLILGKYQVSNQISPFKGQSKGWFLPFLSFFFFSGAFMGLSNLVMLFAGKK
jgi:hypothetical protein